MNKYHMLGIYFLSIALVIYFFGTSYYVFFIMLLLSIVILETTVRLKNNKRDNKLIKHVSKLSDLYVGCHPNLPYAYVPNTECQNNDTPFFPLGKFSYTYPQLKIDSFGCPQLASFDEHVHNCDKGISVSFCGDSVIGNYLKIKDDVYHIPDIVKLELEKNDLSVIIKNFSVGGYTIQDILVKFILRDVFDNPLVVVVNCGYASIRSFFYRNHTTDNTHFRNNFDKLYYLLLIRNCIPDFGLCSLKYLYQQFLPSNTREDLLKFISKEGFDLSSDEKIGLSAFFEHYQNLIYVAKSRGIKVIVTTVPYYFYKETPGHRKFSQVVSLMNEGIKALAIKNKIVCIDLHKNFEGVEGYFIDEAHLSHEGMLVASKLIAASIKLLIINHVKNLGEK